MLSEIPQLRKKSKRAPEEDYRPYVQIFKGTKIIHNDLTLEYISFGYDCRFNNVNSMEK